MTAEKESLLQGHLLKCPRCKKSYSVEQYLRLEETEEFKSETVPIYKCPGCKWIFALAIVPLEVYDEILNFFKRDLINKLSPSTD